MTAHVNSLTAAMGGRGHGPQGLAEIRNRDELDWLLKQSFAEEVSWPTDRASLRALFDLGLRLRRSRGISRSIRSRLKRCLTATSRLLNRCPPVQLAA